ncbi:protein FAM98B [Dendroctonus ponderosae]
MIKETIIFATALLALSQAMSIDKEPNEKVAIPVAVEDKQDVQESDDLQPEASAWGGRGRGGWGGHGKRGGGYGHYGGWGGGHGGYGGGYGGYGGGHRGHWG